MITMILTTQELNRVTGGSGIGKGDDPKARYPQVELADAVPVTAVNPDEKTHTP